MYRTRLDPPPANGWVPPAELLTQVTRTDSSEVVPPQEASVPNDDFVLVAPEPPQPKLDFGGDPPKKVQRIVVDGEGAVFVGKAKKDGRLLITARMDSTGNEKIFTVPPSKVTILDA